MTPHLLLFDIDGTLLRTGGAGMRSMALVCDRLFGAGFKWDGINPGGSLDPIIFAEAAQLNGLDDFETHHHAFRTHYVRELEQQITLNRQTLTVMPGTIDLVRRLRERATTTADIVLGLLTGNYSEAAPIKLRAAGFEPDWFTITAFGEEAPTRPDLVELAMRKYEKAHGARPDPRRVIVIGDTPRDVHCAKAHGCVAFAVATGMHDAAELRDAGADIVVEDLSDATPLLTLLNG